EVSSTAPTCPKCGFVLQKPKVKHELSPDPAPTKRLLEDEKGGVLQLPRRRTWPLIFSVVALVLVVFVISWDYGKFWVDRTQPVPFLSWFYGTVAVWWVIATYRKNASARGRRWAMAYVLPMVALAAVAGFGAGN